MEVQHAAGPAYCLSGVEQSYGRVNFQAAGRPIEFRADRRAPVNLRFRDISLPQRPGVDVGKEAKNPRRGRRDDDLCDRLDGGAFLDRSRRRESISIDFRPRASSQSEEPYCQHSGSFHRYSVMTEAVQSTSALPKPTNHARTSGDGTKTPTVPMATRASDIG